MRGLDPRIHQKKLFRRRWIAGSKPGSDEALGSEPALADQHRIPRTKRRPERNDHPLRAGGFGMCERDAVATGTRRETARDRHRAFDAHIGHVGLFAKRWATTENKERPVG